MENSSNTARTPLRITQTAYEGLLASEAAIILVLECDGRESGVLVGWGDLDRMKERASKPVTVAIPEGVSVVRQDVVTVRDLLGGR